MSATSIIRTLSLLLSLGTAGVWGCMPDPAHDAKALRMLGTCGVDGTRLRVANNGGWIWIEPDRPGVIMPLQGSLTRDGGLVRDGDFQLFGTACGTPGLCADDIPRFVYCSASRIGWAVQLSCIEGEGTPFCEASLDEVGIDP